MKTKVYKREGTLDLELEIIHLVCTTHLRLLPWTLRWLLLNQWGRWLPAGFLLCIIHTCMDGRTTQNNSWFSIPSVASHIFNCYSFYTYTQKKAILKKPVATEFYKHFNFVLKTHKTIARCKSFCIPREHQHPSEWILCSSLCKSSLNSWSCLRSILEILIFKVPNSTKTKGYIIKGSIYSYNLKKKSTNTPIKVNYQQQQHGTRDAYWSSEAPTSFHPLQQSNYFQLQNSCSHNFPLIIKPTRCTNILNLFLE